LTAPAKRDRRVAPVTIPSDDRSPAAKAYQWATRIMVVCLEMVLPGLAGYWVDQKLGTVLAFMLVGLAAGCIVGMWHLMQMIAAENRRDAKRIENSNEGSGE
jgi:F0F1-type ATP synthase assembly protein I